MKMGQQDLTVSKKMKQTGAEYEEMLLDMDFLPPINLARPKTLVTDSPPAGRPGHQEKDGSRKRTRSGLSADRASPTTKASRKEVDKSDEEDEDKEVEGEVEEE